MTSISYMHGVTENMIYKGNQLESFNNIAMQCDPS